MAEGHPPSPMLEGVLFAQEIADQVRNDIKAGAVPQ